MPKRSGLSIVESYSWQTNVSASIPRMVSSASRSYQNHFVQWIEFKTSKLKYNQQVKMKRNLNCHCRSLKIGIYFEEIFKFGSTALWEIGMDQFSESHFYYFMVLFFFQYSCDERDGFRTTEIGSRVCFLSINFADIVVKQRHMELVTNQSMILINRGPIM